jgi:hypothetical protein
MDDFFDSLAAPTTTTTSTTSTTIEALQEHVEFGRACRLCHPYVRRALRTGEVVFRTILTDDDEPR